VAEEALHPPQVGLSCDERPGAVAQRVEAVLPDLGGTGRGSRSFCRMWARCASTVRTDRDSCSAISAFGVPECDQAQERGVASVQTLCIDCDACVEVCPIDAIFADDQLPQEWEHYTKINADYYANKP
jgi:ferredoxin